MLVIVGYMRGKRVVAGLKKVYSRMLVLEEGVHHNYLEHEVVLVGVPEKKAVGY